MKNIFAYFLLIFITTVGFAQDRPVKKVKIHLPAFNTYKVGSLYWGKAATVDLSSNPQGRLFRTAISTGYKENKLNFAGHYCLVEWGCGSPCKQSVIIDLRTGKIYDGPDSSYGYDFKKNSSMVIVNPPGDYNLLDDFGQARPPEVWVLEEQTKKFRSIKIKFPPFPYSQQ